MDPRERAETRTARPRIQADARPAQAAARSGSAGGCRRRSRQRRSAIPDQISSTTPKGHVPARKPYALESAHPPAKASTNPRPRRSSAYMSIMKLRTTTPNAVSTSAEAGLPLLRSGRSAAVLPGVCFELRRHRRQVLMARAIRRALAAHTAGDLLRPSRPLAAPRGSPCGPPRRRACPA